MLQPEWQHVHVGSSNPARYLKTGGEIEQQHTFTLLNQTIDSWESGVTLKAAKTKLLCLNKHGLQRVTDYRPMARHAVLDCGCTRPVTTLTADARHEYEQEVIDRQPKPVEVAA